ncbi:MAG: preprotein translocase subunit SecG [Candidatus Pacebacteria bacterium]|nr:preprotein translocase subunit SecG [Candidatus Paceibacterota bacterium]
MSILTIIHIIISVLLIASILMQSGKAGMGSAFGEGDTFHTEKRGAEKWLFRSTVVLGFLFIAVALLNLFS